MTACDAPPAARAVPTFAPRPTSTPLPPAAKGSIVKVTRGNLTSGVSVRGSVSSVREAVLFFSTSGVISKVVVAAGDQVKQGVAIGQLDAFQLDQDLNLMKFDTDKTDVLLRQAQAKQASYDVQIDLATKNLARITELRDQLFQLYRLKAPTPADHARAIDEYTRYLEIDTQVQQITAELNRLRMEKQISALDVDLNQKMLQYNQKRVESYQARLAGAQLTAPFDGLIVSIDKQVGDLVQAYDSIGAIADPAQLQVEASVAEADMSLVSVGLPVSIVLDGFPDKSFIGKVKGIASKASIYQGKSVYRVVIGFDNPSAVPATLRMGADISLTRQTKQNVLLIPIKAIQQEGAQSYVTVLRGDKWDRAEIRIGMNGANQTEVLSGLAEGDQVLVP
jgi:RND family efflux transporter MFP subunit